MRVSRGKEDLNMGGAQRLAQILNKISGGGGERKAWDWTPQGTRVYFPSGAVIISFLIKIYC